jgi:hypothetical protein
LSALAVLSTDGILDSNELKPYFPKVTIKVIDSFKTN